MKPTLIKKVARDVEKALGYRPEVELVQAAIERYVATATDELRSLVGQLLVISKKGPVKADVIMERDEATIALAARQYEDPTPNREEAKEAPKPKSKKKPKGLDSGVIRFLESEKKCFDPDHASEIDRLREDHARLREAFSLTTQQLEDATARQKLMVDKVLIEEVEKTAYAKGLHDGQAEAEDAKKSVNDAAEVARMGGVEEGRKEREEALVKQKACFNPVHEMQKNMVVQRLSFSQVLRLFEEQRQSSMISNAGAATIPVLVPFGRAIQESEMYQDMSREIERIITRMLRGS